MNTMKQRIITIGVATALALTLGSGSAEARQKGDEGTLASVSRGHGKVTVKPIKKRPASVTKTPSKATVKRYVIVKPGQTLWRLAVIYRGNGYEWTTIAKMNGVKGTKIIAGQKLRVR